MDLNLLIALDALLDERSVTRAAERMHVTQSAMSGVLSRLREYFDDQLLQPVGRTMHLTPRAESLVQPVRDIILKVDATLGVKPEFDPATAQRHFTIIASDYVASVLLADVLSRIATTAPGLSFEFPRAAGTAMMQDLEAGRVDFIILPAHLVIEDQPQEFLFEDRYQVIACIEHPQLHGEITMAQYQALGHVVYQSQQGINPWFEQWYANQNSQPRRVEVATNNFGLMPRFVAGTLRIATVQARLAQQFERTMPVQLLDFPMGAPRLTEVLQWHAYREQDPGIQWVREQIVAQAREMAPI